jgi:hypothetical protein
LNESRKSRFSSSKKKLEADISIDAKVPWLSYASAEQDFRPKLFRQPRIVVKHCLVEEVCFDTNMANVAGYTFAARLCEAEAGGVTPP